MESKKTNKEILKDLMNQFKDIVKMYEETEEKGLDDKSEMNSRRPAFWLEWLEIKTQLISMYLKQLDFERTLPSNKK